MRIFIVDSDRDTRIKLKRMIEERCLGTVVGMSAGWEDAFLKVRQMYPDVILSEFSLPEAKVLPYICRMKKISKEITIVLLSQIHNAEIIGQAYEKGADLIMRKPIVLTEIEKALYYAQMEKTAKCMIERIKSDLSRTSFPGLDEKIIISEEVQGGVDVQLRHLKEILQDIGILSETGSKDIVALIRYLLDHDMDLRDITVGQLCSRMNQNPRSMEQRIRRTAQAGLVHLAARGLDNSSDPIFREYSSGLYSLEEIKREMNYIDGISERHGNIRIKKFLSGLLDYSKEI